jgi:arylsulfatase A-like enzyme
MPTDHPENVLFVFTDQQRQDSLGCYGGVAETPNLDGLAASGTRFDRAYTPTAICSPARAATVSGMRPHHNGVARNTTGDVDLHERCPCYPGLLREAGYNVGLSGKWHVGDPGDFGFDGDHIEGHFYSRDYEEYLAYLDERDLPRMTEDVIEDRFPDVPGVHAGGRDTRPQAASFTEYVTTNGEEMIGEYADAYHQEGTPFYQSVHYFGPHNPYYLPEPYWSMYDPEDIELPESAVKETFENKPRAHRAQADVSSLDEIPIEDWRRIVAAYRGWVTYIDDQVGRLLDTLETEGVRDDTLVVFSSDHGGFATAHKMHDKGPAMYEDIYNVPFIADGLGIESDHDAFVSLLDLAPTFLDAAGVDIPEEYDGASLFDIDADHDRNTARAEFHGHQFPYEQRMLRDGRYKLVLNERDTAELYDLEEDPNELDNKIGNPAYGAVAERLYDRLVGELAAEGDDGMEPNPSKLSGMFGR